MPSNAADLWSASKRGPPPGLGTQKSVNSGNGNMSNNWMGLIGGGPRANWQGSGNASGGGGGWSSASSSSSWLLLKNLTAQVSLCFEFFPF